MARLAGPRPCAWPRGGAGSQARASARPRPRLRQAAWRRGSPAPAPVPGRMAALGRRPAPALALARACARPRGGAAHRPPPLCQACAGARPRPRLWQAVRRCGSPAPARTWEGGREEAEGGREEEAFVGGWMGGDVEGERGTKKIRLRERSHRIGVKNSREFGAGTFCPG